MRSIFRHGDIPLVSTNKIEGEVIGHNGSIVLAEGETTGHKHVLTVPNMEDVIARRLPDGGYVLTLKREGTLTHEEHKTLVVPPGTYRVGKEREMDWFQKAVRKVID